METLEVESETDQTPFPRSRLFSPQRKLAEAENFLNNPDDWFDGALACAIDHFAQSRLEFVGHLDLSAGILWWRIWQFSETL